MMLVIFLQHELLVNAWPLSVVFFAHHHNHIKHLSYYKMSKMVTLKRVKITPKECISLFWEVHRGTTQNKRAVPL